MLVLLVLVMLGVVLLAGGERGKHGRRRECGVDVGALVVNEVVVVSEGVESVAEEEVLAAVVVPLVVVVVVVVVHL